MVGTEERCPEAASIVIHPRVVYRWVSDDRLRLAQICLLNLACIWGADYLMKQPRGSLNIVEHVIPLIMCGVLFLFFGVMGIIGELWMELGRSQKLSFVAHAGLCAIYTALTAGYMMEMAVHWHLWGMRSPAIMFSFAAMHYAFAQKRSPDATP